MQLTVDVDIDPHELAKSLDMDEKRAFIMAIDEVASTTISRLMFCLISFIS